MTWLRLALANLKLSPMTTMVNILLMGLGTASIVFLLPALIPPVQRSGILKISLCISLSRKVHWAFLNFFGIFFIPKK